MPSAIFQNPGFYRLLLRFDQDLASTVQAGSCPQCGGRLHRANYHRQPRGGPQNLTAEECIRFSFCCDREGCRKRITPPSVRFLDRRVYLGAIVVLVCAMRHGLTQGRLERLKASLGVGCRTLQRWMHWWRESFPQTALWTIAKAYFMPPVSTSCLPGTLLERFEGPDDATRLYSMLRFLALYSTGFCTLFDGRVVARRT